MGKIQSIPGKNSVSSPVPPSLPQVPSLLPPSLPSSFPPSGSLPPSHGPPSLCLPACLSACLRRCLPACIPVCLPGSLPACLLPPACQGRQKIYVPHLIFYVSHLIFYVPHLIFYIPPQYSMYPSRSSWGRWVQLHNSPRQGARAVLIGVHSIRGKIYVEYRRGSSSQFLSEHSYVEFT